jgi:hypothetical protein
MSNYGKLYNIEAENLNLWGGDSCSLYFSEIYLRRIFLLETEEN